MRTAQHTGALGLFLGLSLLMLVLASGALLDRLKVRFISEAAVGLLVGLALGLTVRLVGSDDSGALGAGSSLGSGLAQAVNFDPGVFFLVLLPPIIFESGYCMHSMAFFRFVKNFGAILAFAFVGTAVSAALVGLVCFAAGQAGLVFDIDLLDALLFGSLISATDPVTVLSIFQKVGADLNLWSLIYGESVLNDAVAIVLYTTLARFKDEQLSVSAVLGGVGSFLAVFFGSLLIGVSTALLVRFAIAWRFWDAPDVRRQRSAGADGLEALGSFGRDRALARRVSAQSAEDDGDAYDEAELSSAEHHELQYEPFELALLLLAPLAAYMLSDFLELSGIVAILFCGIAMARYARPVASPGARAVSIEVYRIAAKITETAVFVYMGSAVLIQPMQFAPAFFGVALLACLLARAANVFPMVRAINAVRKRKARAIPLTHKLMLWWSGLRGAIAFALALRFRQDLLDAAAGGSPGEGSDAAMERAKQTGDAVFTTTALIVLATVLVVGGSTNALIEHLQLKEPSMPPSERDELLLAEGGGDALDSNGGALGRGANGGTDDADEHGIELGEDIAFDSEYARDVERSKNLELPWERLSRSRAAERWRGALASTALARNLLSPRASEASLSNFDGDGTRGGEDEGTPISGNTVAGSGEHAGEPPRPVPEDKGSTGGG